MMNMMQLLGRSILVALLAAAPLSTGVVPFDWTGFWGI